jgi:hypothetical protein
VTKQSLVAGKDCFAEFTLSRAKVLAMTYSRKFADVPLRALWRAQPALRVFVSTAGSPKPPAFLGAARHAAGAVRAVHVRSSLFVIGFCLALPSQTPKIAQELAEGHR